jgi:eukaryotic-like serine/threonine-protein kinase
MGQVWSAFDSTLSRRVAIKLVELDDLDPEGSKRRFEREAALSRQLRGPSFVEVYDQGWIGRRPYLVMELLEGETLQERLARVGTLSPEEALLVLRAIGTCLRLAHTLQIVHRDLKPGNIFFAKAKSGRSGVRAIDGSGEIVKLIDFGIAKDAWDDARLTRPDVLLGSAFYMSPEQLRSGRDVDARSDLWALSVILFRAITGHRPFSGGAAEALAKIVASAPPLASSIRPALGTSFDAFFVKALEKDPSDRFQSIDDLLEGFVAAVKDHEPVAIDLDDCWEVAEPPPLPAASEPPTVITPRSDEMIPVIVEEAASLPVESPRERADTRPPRRRRRHRRRWLVGVGLVLACALAAAASIWLAPR